MFHSSRMHWYFSSLFCLSLIAAGCSGINSSLQKNERTVKADKTPPADPPSQYPGWAYDAPGYMRPAAEAPSEVQAKPTDPLHFFTREKIVSIRRPGNYTPEEAPRVAIYWTDNNGFRWNKAGYFGRDQSFFPFHVEEDGDYGVRFVGPGQEPAKEAPAYPERVYHVDTAAPEVEVSIEPEQTWYTPGQSVTIAWQTKDYHLIEKPVTIYMVLDISANDFRPVELQRDLGNEGTYAYEIPMETLDHEIRFRVEALDRAANLGMGTSFALQIVNDLPAEESNDDDLIALKKHEPDQAELSNVPRATAKSVEANRAAPVYSTEVVRSGREKPPSVPEEALDDEPDDQSELAGVADQTPQPRKSSTKSQDTDSLGMNLDSQLAIREPRRAKEVSLESLAARLLNPEPPLETMLLNSGDPEPVLDQAQADQVAAESFPIAQDIAPARRIGASATDNAVARLDPLVVPFPATLDASEFDSRWNIAHPWRLLGNIVASSSRYVWTLPQLNDERLDRIFEGSNVEGEIPPVSKLPTSSEILVGEPGETPEPSDMP